MLSTSSRMLITTPTVRAVVRRTASAISSRYLTTLSTHHSVPTWATLDPNELGTVSTHTVLNAVGGSWQKDGDVAKKLIIPNPLNKGGLPICTVPDTSVEELGPFVWSMEGVGKSGVHNPLKNVERYLMYGEISRKVRTFSFVLRMFVCVVVCAMHIAWGGGDA